MIGLRPVLNALLGLLLLVQATAVAWANGSVTAAADDAPASTEAPCHGDDSSPHRPPCCDADCPDMTSCTLGHFVLASTPAVAVGPAKPPWLSPQVISPPPVVPPSLLRPPIPWLHV